MIYRRNVKGLRRAISATVLLIGLGVSIVSGPPRSVADEAGHDFQICKGRYALCAASTCKPTGNSITVNVIGAAPHLFRNMTAPVRSLTGPPSLT